MAAGPSLPLSPAKELAKETVCRAGKKNQFRSKESREATVGRAPHGPLSFD